MNKKVIFICVTIIVLIAAGIGIQAAITEARKPGVYDTFATCLENEGAMFYGAFWCPHCQEQKKQFGKSAKLLPYTECSTADGRNQLAVCKEAGIEGYPTWVFADQSRLSGRLSFETLAEKTGCVLP